MGSLLANEKTLEHIVLLNQDILDLILFYLSYDTLILFSQTNKYYRKKINSADFTKIRYFVNPRAKDAVTNYCTNKIINKLMDKSNQNSIFIELKSCYSNIYQNFGFTEDELEHHCTYNYNNIRRRAKDLVNMQIAFHGSGSLIQFTCQIDDGAGYFSSRGDNMTREQLYDSLYWVVFFENIGISYSPIYNERNPILNNIQKIQRKNPKSIVTKSIIENYEKYKMTLK